MPVKILPLDFNLEEKETLRRRLFDRTQPDHISGCLNWTGALNSNEYGRIRIQKRMFYTHRLAYVLFIGNISDNLSILHKCDNPRCINPEHLFIGTLLDNSHDSRTKGRNFHILSRKQVIEIRKRNMQRSPDSYNLLAKEFKVSKSCIQHIINKDSWKHLK